MKTKQDLALEYLFWHESNGGLKNSPFGNDWSIEVVGKHIRELIDELEQSGDVDKLSELREKIKCLKYLLNDYERWFAVLVFAYRREDLG